MTEPATLRSLTRRRVLLGLNLPLAALLLHLPTRRAEAALRERSVLLHHRHTGETLRSTYFAEGRYQPSALREATHHLRDWRDQSERPVDPRLLDLLWSLRAALDTSAPIEVFCGYRSPATNAMLRRTRRGAARHSLHMRAMAIDLQVEGRSLRSVHGAAVALGRGGVGYYPRSGFVHVDTGDIRYW
jgi:uncharacterized protein YcbK (DUF882 family)